MRQNFNTIALLVMVLGLALTQKLNWKLCPGADSKSITIDSIDISPYPVIKGKSITFVATGKANVDLFIKGGLVEVFAGKEKRMTVPVGPSGSAKAGTTAKYGFSQVIPPTITSGTYEFRMSLLDTKGSAITCITFTQSF